MTSNISEDLICARAEQLCLRHAADSAVKRHKPRKEIMRRLRRVTARVLQLEAQAQQSRKDT